MKHHLFVWGTNPQPFRGKADSSIVLPISVEEMAKYSIIHKVLSALLA